MHPSIFTKLYIINLILSEPQTHQAFFLLYICKEENYNSTPPLSQIEAEAS